MYGLYWELYLYNLLIFFLTINTWRLIIVFEILKMGAWYQILKTHNFPCDTCIQYIYTYCTYMHTHIHSYRHTAHTDLHLWNYYFECRVHHAEHIECCISNHSHGVLKTLFWYISCSFATIIWFNRYLAYCVLSAYIQYLLRPQSL